ncbi:MAG TPA: 2-phosphosulfolactate phosphatase [Candidatus Methylomirabilis sp.]|nr:2-phosphosulfolactate phosphatase [Candidatus Methylomirabilis sp.]
MALTSEDVTGLALDGWSAIAVDVLRATSTVIAACAAGCARVIPVGTPDAARLRAGEFAAGEALLAGEQGGEPVPGFALGNSPLEFTAERVRGRTIVLSTTNGTRAMLTASAAAAAAAAALTNAGAAAAWALAEGRDVAVLCSGDNGAFSLEDAVCAGLIAAHLAAVGRAELSGAARAAVGLGEHYGARIDQLRTASRWARRLARAGRTADLDACLRLDVTDLVPIIEAGAFVAGPGASATARAAAPRAARRG